MKGQGTAEDLVSAGLIGADVIVGRVEAPLTAARDDKSSRLVDVHTPSDELSSRGSFDMEFPPAANSVPDPEPDYKEDKFTGVVPWSVVRSYLTSMGAQWYWAAVLSLFAAQQLASLGTNLWIKEWAREYNNLATKPTSTPKTRPAHLASPSCTPTARKTSSGSSRLRDPRCISSLEKVFRDM